MYLVFQCLLFALYDSYCSFVRTLSTAYQYLKLEQVGYNFVIQLISIQLLAVCCINCVKLLFHVFFMILVGVARSHRTHTKDSCTACLLALGSVPAQSASCMLADLQVAYQ